MSRIDKLMDIKNDDSLLDNEKPLEDAEREKILQMTMRKIQINKPKKFSKKKWLVGVLVATMMIGTVAMANEYFELNLDNTLLSYLGIDKNNESLKGAGVNINKSVTDNGLKLTIRQTLADKHNIYILIDVEAPSNIIIPENAYFNNTSITLKKQSSAGWSIQDLEDEDYNDNKQSYIISYNTQGKLKGNEISVDFKDFGYYSEEKDEFISLVNGEWKVSWELDYTDVSKEIIVNRFIKSKNGSFFITSVNISPISISANLIGRNNGNFRIDEITLKDGQSYNGNYNNDIYFSSQNISSSFLKAYTSAEFSKILDINNIESITIDGKVIKLNN